MSTENKFWARNTATDALLTCGGLPVVGTRAWVAKHIEALISPGNRPAYVIEPVA